MANDYGPGGNPTEDPRPGYGGYIPFDKFDYPGWLTADNQELYDKVIGGYETVMGARPKRLLRGLMEKTGITGGQAGDWLTKQLTGRGAGERATKYKDIQMGRLNRFATREAGRLRQGSAETGGYGSSSAARQIAEGKTALVGARGEVDVSAMEYEDTLRANMFGRGMGALGMVSGIVSQDEAAQAGWLDDVQGAGGQLLDVAGMQMTEAQLGNAYNQWRYAIEHGETDSDFMEFLGQVISAGATLGAASM